jgi:molybdopterin-guanine dinucleotide biosynthesis protein A
LSVGWAGGLYLNGFIPTRDIYPDCGPMAGLHAALTDCLSDALLVVTCDVPLFKRELGEYLVECLTPEYDAVLAVARDGRIHPYCGVYKKTTAALLEQHLATGQCCMWDVFDKMRVHHAILTNTPYPDCCLANINTPQEYAALQQQANLNEAITVLVAQTIE